jgi:hypothetical protein
MWGSSIVETNSIHLKWRERLEIVFLVFLCYRYNTLCGQEKFMHGIWPIKKRLEFLVYYCTAHANNTDDISHTTSHHITS